LRWDWRHLVLYREKLEALRAGTIQSLMVFMPPQMGKSLLGTVHFPVHWLTEDPTLRVVVGCYGQELAGDFGRASRRLARSTGLAISDERQAASDWQTPQGGRYLAVGAGTGVTGRGADLIVVDDPIKSRREADSQAHRNAVYDWLMNDLFTRGPQARRLIVCTRWHWDDPVARLLKGATASDWEVLSLPALARAPDPLGRGVGEALCPERQTVKDLERIRLERGEYVFGSLYQQDPTPRTGNLFPRAKVGDPVKAAPAGTRWARGWDKAGTKDGGKRSAGVRLGLAPDSKVIVGHVVRGQWAALEREQVIKTQAAIDTPSVKIVLEQEPGSGGKESAESTVRMLQGYPVSVRVASGQGDKFARSDPFAAQWQAGNVVLVEGDWNDLFLDELEMAGPGAAYLDCMDAAALAYNELTLHARQFQPVQVRWA
jgi:predicted phage terminase large subunit-like protein